MCSASMTTNAMAAKHRSSTSAAWYPFFDALGLACAKVLGNKRRNRIADGDKNQRKHILYSHRRRIACQRLCAEWIYNCLHNQHTDGHRRLLKNRRHGNLQHGLQPLPVKSLKWALVSPHPMKKNTEGKITAGNSLGRIKVARAAPNTPRPSPATIQRSIK